VPAQPGDIAVLAVDGYGAMRMPGLGRSTVLGLAHAGELPRLHTGRAASLGFAGRDPPFIVWEARSSHPMLPLHLFGNPRFTGAGVTITVLFFALSGAVFVNSQILQFVLGYSPLAAGVRGRWGQRRPPHTAPAEPRGPRCCTRSTPRSSAGWTAPSWRARSRRWPEW
jgi:hypothetical protein